MVRYCFYLHGSIRATSQSFDEVLVLFLKASLCTGHMMYIFINLLKVGFGNTMRKLIEEVGEEMLEIDETVSI